MKVCVLLPVLDPFKGGNHLPLFAAAKDTEFTVLCNRSKAEESELPSNVSVITLPGRIGQYYYGIADALFSRLVLKQYRTKSDFWKQFDVIHSNQVMGPALRKLRKTGVPLLFLIHHPVTADRDIAMQESSGLRKYIWWLRYVCLVHFQKKMCKAATHVATVSETMKERIIDDYQVSPQKISVVPNGVDGDLFSPVPDASCTSDIIAIGSFIHPRKGFPYLVELYKRLASSGYKILDVGRRTDEQRRELTSLSGITTLGTVSEEQLIDSLRHARVLVSTSLYEGFGLSLIEALACGHPSFAFAVGAVPEVLTPIDPELIVEPRNIEELAKRAITYLSLSAPEREEKGAAYRAAVLQQHSLEQSANRLQQLYTELAV